MQGLEHLGQSQYFDYIPEKIKDRHGNIVSNPAFEEFVNTACPSFDYVPEPGQEKLYTSIELSQGGGGQAEELLLSLNTYLIDFDGVDGRQEVEIIAESEDAALAEFHGQYDATYVHSIKKAEGEPMPETRELALIDVSGIGEATANKLIDKGINTVQELLATEVDRIIEITGFSAKKAENVLANAKKLLEGEG